MRRFFADPVEPEGTIREIPSVAYVRMSTEHQQFSTQNQLEKIEAYALSRSFRIVRTYADEGKSGLTITGRPGLRRLLEDAEADGRDFQAILVYDISRFGRFQDADEAASYGATLS